MTGIAQLRVRSWPSEARSAGRRGQGNTTGRWRDKSPCHACIQAAAAACLSPCRPVDPRQVQGFSRGISKLRHAQSLSRAALPAKVAAL